MNVEQGMSKEEGHERMGSESHEKRKNHDGEELANWRD
jgi:hypothetical protein